MQGDHANQLEAAVLAPLRDAREGRHAAQAGRLLRPKLIFSPWHEVRTDGNTGLEGGFTNAARNRQPFSGHLNAMARPVS